MREMVGGCCVCSDERGWDENPLVYCDGAGCTVAVHQACYGIVCVPTGPWYCRKCEWSERPSRVRCELCPSRDGALKRTECSSWAHVVCALYIPEVRFGNVSTMEPIVLGLVPSDRYAKVCYLCEKQGRESKASSGACMQCNRAGCKSSFHVTCAQSQGLLCEEAGNYMDNVKYCGYCEYHYSKINKKIIKTIPAYKPVSSAAPSPSSSPDKPSSEAMPSASGGATPATPAISGGSGGANVNSSSSSATNLPAATAAASTNPAASSVASEAVSSISNLKKMKKARFHHRSNPAAEATGSPPAKIEAEDAKAPSTATKTEEPTNGPPTEEAKEDIDKVASPRMEDEDMEPPGGPPPSPALSMHGDAIKGSKAESNPASAELLLPKDLSMSSAAAASAAAITPNAPCDKPPFVKVESAALVISAGSVSSSAVASNPPPSEAISSNPPPPERPHSQPPVTDEYAFVSHDSEGLSVADSGVHNGSSISSISLPAKRGVGRPPKKGTHLHSSSLTSSAMSAVPVAASTGPPAVRLPGSSHGTPPPVHGNPLRRPSPLSSPELESASSFKKKRKKNAAAAASQPPPTAPSAAPVTLTNTDVPNSSNSVFSNGVSKPEDPSRISSGAPPASVAPPAPASTMWMMGTSLNPGSSVAKEMNMVLQNEISSHSVNVGPLSRLSGLPVPRTHRSSVRESFVFPPNKRSTSSSSTLNMGGCGGGGGSSSSSSSHQPQTLEELLERQWEQGSQFIMETAASSHFDIASLLSSLNQLKDENAELETSVERLVLRRDHLLAVRARLLALSMAYASSAAAVNPSPSPGAPSAQGPPGYLNGPPPRPKAHRPLENGSETRSLSSATIIPVSSSSSGPARAHAQQTNQQQQQLRYPPSYAGGYPPGNGSGLLSSMHHPPPARNTGHQHLHHGRPMDKR